MVDWYGRWTPEPDYSTYPKEEWCDMDYVAAWMKGVGYVPKTSWENVITKILGRYDWCDEVRRQGYFALKDNRSEDDPERWMVYIPDIEEFVGSEGGLQEFDYWS